MAMLTRDFNEIELKAAAKIYMQLWDLNRHQEKQFQGLREWHQRLALGNFVVLQRRFQIRCFTLTTDKPPLAIAYLFIPNDPRHPMSLGNILFAPNYRKDDANLFWSNLKATLLEKYSIEKLKSLVVGMNGCLELGLSYPISEDSDVAFLTTSPASWHHTAFSQLPVQRTLKALNTQMTPQLLQKIETELKNIPEGYSTRPINLFNFKKEIEIYADLVRKGMQSHPLFWPLTNEEVYDIMKDLKWILPSQFFQFLLHEGKEIGFCFAIPDYNQILRDCPSDVIAVWRLLTQKSQITRGRIIYSVILPEYQGQKLIRFARHQVIQTMANNGYSSFESSYIDFENVKSLKNAESTQAQVSHDFYTYGLDLEP